MKVNEIFYSFQGEGPYSGTPCLFLRLSGCNYNCSFCDTDHESYTEYKVKDLSRKLRDMMDEYNTNLIVITGGEPILQYDELSELCTRLKCNIQIETNGSIIKPIIEKAEYVISPKANHELIFDFYHEFDNVYFKFLILDQSDIDMIKQLQSKYNYNRTIWVQPVYEKDKENTTMILRNSLKNVKISGQLHKYLDQR